MSKPLSARAVETMKPGDPVKIDAGENSGLRVTCGKTGTKTFIYRYKSPETGKLRQVSIGRYPQVSLSEARMELQRLKGLRRGGICPKAEAIRNKEIARREAEDKAKEQREADFTVTDLVEAYLTEVIEDRFIKDPHNPEVKKKVPGARKLKGQSETRRTLYGDAVRCLGGISASKVTRKLVTDMVMSIVDRGANVQAGNVLRELTAAYDYSIGLGRLGDEFANPALLAKSSLKQARVRLTSKRGRRVLSDKELALVLKWIPGSGFSTTQKNVLHFTLWTGCRTGEVCNAEWKDIDLVKGVWHLRDSKNGAERHVQLSQQAINFLKGLELVSDTYLFPSTRTKLPIQQKSLTETKWHLKNPDKVKNGQRYKSHQLWLQGMEDWSPHDLRRTVRTGLSRLGCPSEVAEAILGHSKKGIEGTYDLHKYERECGVWLQNWADHLEGVVA
ncbi:MAG: integrase [Oceanospirillaceae bacterium]|nr:integrase [Oceanospirillaceae bacterium]|tara:strand:- start:4302 stop:5639 length:1338 start_codon:yes stop_codon:yes gene_type:complete